MNAQHCVDGENTGRRLLVALLTAHLLLGCGGDPAATEHVAQAEQALNICNETVPDEHIVDGIPAYAQCGETTGAVWSNNGVDTSSTSLGSDWVRTQFSGGYQCTEYARRYLLFRWDIDYQGGNGGEWCDGTLPATLLATSVPVHGDLVVFAPGSCGADPVYGHIAVVDVVDEDRSEVTFVEQNRANRRSCAIDTARCFLHAVANDGETGSGGTGGAGGSTGTGGSGGTIEASCSDGVLNQDETDRDCGGSSCPPCADGAACQVASDCASGICESGTCGCGADLTLCGGSCVDTSTDSANCGACGNICAVGQVCNLGVCSVSCAAGLTLCGQDCVDTSTSLDHCGACYAACALPGAVAACVGGSCTLSSCQAGFYDLDQNPANGCEYSCVPAGAEVCNGVDDDCNGQIDDGDVCLGSGGTGGATPTPGTGGTPSGGTAPTVEPTITGGTVATSGTDGILTGGTASAADVATAGSGPSATTNDTLGEKSGCACSMGGSRQRLTAPLGLLIAALLLRRRRARTVK